MCGIVGYIGQQQAVPIILDGLKRLEYRGYDSAGIAVLDAGDCLNVRRASGKLRNLEDALHLSPLQGLYGIGHTRWATHGRPTEENAHPHRDCHGDMAILTRDGVHLTDFNGRPVKRQVSHILWDPIMAEKGGYKHFMLKEIYEQPRAVRDTTLGRVGQESGRIFLDEMDISDKEFKEFRQVRIVACGTSWHAALAGKFMIERLARVPVEVDYGSEFGYRDPLVSNDTLTVVISQSGETADTLAAQREAKLKGSKTLAICNVVGSMVTREAAG